MVQIRREKTDVLTISIPKNLKRDLKNFAQERDLPVSKITKDALRYYIWLNRWNKLQDAFAPVFKKLGIKTDDDVEKYFG